MEFQKMQNWINIRNLSKKRHLLVWLGFILIFILMFTQFYRVSKIRIRYTNEVKAEWETYETSGRHMVSVTTEDPHSRFTVEGCRTSYERQNTTRKWFWSSGYRNPCWKGKRFSCAPYFFVTGFPKCGTTDLFERMSFHPEFVPPLFKEIHWMTRYRFLMKRTEKPNGQTIPTPIRDLRNGFSEYLSVFSPLAAHLEECRQPYSAYVKPTFSSETTRHSCNRKITGDFSPSTIWDADMYMRLPINKERVDPVYTPADFVYDMNPCAKIIVMMRNPVTRLYSDYLHFYINKSPEDFHRIVRRTIDLYNKCFTHFSVRQCVYNFNIERQGGARLRQGIYYIYILDWLERFPRDQFLFVKLEEYANKTAIHMDNIFNFLEMGPVDSSLMHRIVKAEPSNTRKGRSSDIDAPPMLEKTRRILKNFYEPFNKKLSNVLSDSRYLWKS